MWLGLGIAFWLSLPLSGAAAAPDAPSGYSVAVATAERALLLAADEAAWAHASVVTWGPAAYETRFRALWSDDGLHLRFDATDPSPWHTMTKRDEHLWEEEVVEIFLDPDRSGRHYYELEISPANVVCDLDMISPMPNYKSDFAWDLAGLETRVHAAKDADGTRDRLDGHRVPALARAARAALGGPRRDTPQARRPLALQRVPHRPARRQGEPGEGRRAGGVVAAFPEELPRPLRLPRLRVRRPGALTERV